MRSAFAPRGIPHHDATSGVQGSPMKILVLTWIIPATANMPGSPRLFSLCKGLSADHELTLVAFSRDAERLATFRNDPLTDGVFRDVVVLDPPPAAEWWRQQVHRLRQEAHFVTRSRHPEYHARQREIIRQLVLHHEFDAIYADGLSMAQYLADLDIACPAIVDLHDSLTLLHARTMKVETRWLRKLALYAETRSIARWERQLSRWFQLIITNSEVDERFIKSLDATARTLTIGNGVDCDFFSPGDEEREEPTLVFTGVMDYGPNEDAAIYFADVMLPSIRRDQPNVEFWIVGKDPSDRVRQLASRPGVHVTGGVSDIRPYVRGARIFVCPIRYGAGIKNKLLAALAMEKAVVATPLSLEGLALEDNVHVLTADDPELFARCVTRLLGDADLRRRLGRDGRRFVQREYSWAHSAMVLDASLREIVASQGAALPMTSPR